MSLRNILAAWFVVAGPSISFACSPDIVRYNVDSAGAYLRRAAQASSDVLRREQRVREAQDYARLAYKALSDTQNELVTCECVGPAEEFAYAATYARRAHDESNPVELRDYIQRAIRGFRTGVDGVNAGLCR